PWGCQTPPEPPGLLLGVIAADALDFVLRAEDHTDALVQLLGLDVQDALLAVDRSAAGLFDDHAHGVGLVHQAQFAGLAGLARIPGVHEDAAARHDPVHVGHHRGDP